MNELQLAKWEQDFEAKAKALQIEFDAFFLEGKFEDSYQLQRHEESNILSLVILNPSLPHDIQNSLAGLLLLTKPVEKNYNQLNKIKQMEHQQAGHHHAGHNYDDLIQQLLSAAKTAEKCSASCLEEENVMPLVHCIELTRDCADLCFLAARLLSRDSEFAREFVQLCANACSHCGDECVKHQHEHCKACGVECYQCAKACHALSENSL